EHDRMATIFKAAHAANPDMVFTDEAGAETAIDIFANRLIHYEIWPGNVPMFSTVYHDYTTSYGRTVSLLGRKKNRKDPIPRMQIGWQLIAGDQLGRLWSS